MTKKATKITKKERGKRRKKSVPKNINWILTCSICHHEQSISGEGNYACPCGAKYRVGKMHTGTGDWQLNIMLMNRDEVTSVK